MVADGLPSKSYRTGVHGNVWAVLHVRPFSSGRRFTFITDCSAFMWLFRSRDLELKLYRWALRVTEFDGHEGESGIVPPAP